MKERVLLETDDITRSNRHGLQLEKFRLFAGKLHLEVMQYWDRLTRDVEESIILDC